MKLLLKQVLVAAAAALTLSGDGILSLTPRSLGVAAAAAAAAAAAPAAAETGGGEGYAARAPSSDPKHRTHPPTGIGHDFHEQDDPEERAPRDSNHHGQPLPADVLDPFRPGKGFRHSPPSHPDGRRDGRARPNDVHRRAYKKGDGSLPSHAYDYLYDELTELREELVDTEETFGVESDEVQVLNSQIRLREQIRRQAKMLDGGMPQEEFDKFVADLTRLFDLRLEEHVSGVGSATARRKRQDEEGDRDPDDEMNGGYGQGASPEDVEKQRARSKEMMALSEEVRRAKEHWRIIPKPMTHDASAELRDEIMEVYAKIHETSDRDERLALRDQLEHLQTVIHDSRRHRDMDPEDAETITKLREESLTAESEDARREIREEIEAIYRAHRKKVRATRSAERERSETPNRSMKYLDDETVVALQEELKNAQDRDTRKAVRKKIRERMQELHRNDPDVPEGARYRPPMSFDGPANTGPARAELHERLEPRRPPHQDTSGRVEDIDLASAKSAAKAMRGSKRPNPSS